jgi:peptide deformylase
MNHYLPSIMSIRTIISLPDPLLRKVSTPLTNIDGATKALALDMLETMYDAPGIGLAAVQIGITQRIVTVDLARGDDPKDPHIFINPEIIWTSDALNEYEEGCLSIPDYHEIVVRPSKVGVRWLDLDGNPTERELDGLFATCIQHEIDHLNGKLFIDHLSRLKRERVIKKFTKQARRELDE